LVQQVEFGHTENVLDTVKPARLIQRMLQVSTSKTESDLVLDFFAGSGSTGDAVLCQNTEDGGNRRFILVQLPEPLPIPEDRLKTIADITRQRVTSAGRQLATSQNGKLPLDGAGKLPPDTGFRAYRLDASNFTPWDGDPGFADRDPRQSALFPDLTGVARQIALAADNVLPGRFFEDILAELLLKRGFDLAEPVSRTTLAGHTVHAVADGGLLVCLDKTLTLPLFDAVAALEPPPAQLICLDAAFPDDQTKVNAWETIQSANRTRDTNIEFLVV